ncbi:hypothetical protein LBBP_02206 [Leptospira borgpetersenii serovar Ballum]|uniref:Uncharacterized protein n=1 Tax=Leptospira borgpetersenii serovar Ballum TaxID=280505 RepID=A0A0S2IS35_LEPBO|nr:hypothetical protein LBBP_02206 [Leptospira borgpetersenii serovar Ballum]
MSTFSLNLKFLFIRIRCRKFSASFLCFLYQPLPHGFT